MSFSRYFGIPLLAAFSLGISLALLPLEPNTVTANNTHSQVVVSAAVTPA